MFSFLLRQQKRISLHYITESNYSMWCLQTNDARPFSQNYFIFLSHVCKTFIHLVNHLAPLKPCSHWQQLAETNQVEVRVNGRWQHDTACPTGWRSRGKFIFIQISIIFMHQAYMCWIHCYCEWFDYFICLCSRIAM